MINRRPCFVRAYSKPRMPTHADTATHTEAAAVKLKPGHYVFQNVKTRQKLVRACVWCWTDSMQKY